MATTVNEVSNKRFLNESDFNDSGMSNKKLRSNVPADEVEDVAETETITEINAEIDRSIDTVFLCEKDVGITERVGKVSNCSGTIKQRYSDFIVNEIDRNGRIVSLTNLQPPEKKSEELFDSDAILGSETKCQLKKLSESSEDTDPVIIKINNRSKSERQEIHQTIRQNYDHLSSNTEERENEKVIVVYHASQLKNSNVKGAFRKTPSWPINQPNYTQFVLYKENMNSMEAIGHLAKYLRMKDSTFTYAGVKDKRAKTAQLVTVYRVAPEKLANMKSNNLKLGNYEFVNEPLKLGDLLGNRFKIVLRQVTGTEAEIERVMESLRTNGFINYYGMQRFGTTAIPTHRIGKALMLANWQEAIELILKPRTGDNDRMTECRKLWWSTRDAKLALEKVHRKNSIEGQLLSGLVRFGPKDMVNSLNCIPRNTRLMYIHSYQSYIWNLVVSKRIRTYGLQVLDGDLVNSDDSKGDMNEDTKSRMPTIHRSDNAHDVTIFDVVMPLPGHSVIYPSNEMSTWYKEFLKQDGVSEENFTSRVKTYSLQGGYRKLVIRPKDLSWSIMKYTDLTKPLVLSDLDVLNGESVDSIQDSDGDRKAIALELSLPSSSYATMALREVINVDTSVAFQTCLNSQCGSKE